MLFSLKDIINFNLGFNEFQHKCLCHQDIVYRYPSWHFSVLLKSENAKHVKNRRTILHMHINFSNTLLKKILSDNFLVSMPHRKEYFAFRFPHFPFTYLYGYDLHTIYRNMSMGVPLKLITIKSNLTIRDVQHLHIYTWFTSYIINLILVRLER